VPDAKLIHQRASAIINGVTSPVLECVPNVSEGRDRRIIERLGLP
jgi:hypothetical protein